MLDSSTLQPSPLFLCSLRQPLPLCYHKHTSLSHILVSFSSKSNFNGLVLASQQVRTDHFSEAAAHLRSEDNGLCDIIEDSLICRFSSRHFWFSDLSLNTGGWQEQEDKWCRSWGDSDTKVALSKNRTLCYGNHGHCTLLTSVKQYLDNRMTAYITGLFGHLCLPMGEFRLHLLLKKWI